MMAKDWTKLAEELMKNKTETKDNTSSNLEYDILIGKIDCTKRRNRPICDHYGIDSFPTLMYGNVVDLQVYHGMRSVKDWKHEVINAQLSRPLCGVKTPEVCSARTQFEISKWRNLGIEVLDKELKKKEAQIRKLEDDFDLEVDKLNEQMDAFKAKRRSTNKEKQVIGSKLRLMKSILSLREREES